MSNATYPKRAAIYARISDDREGKGTNVDIQIKACQELAERLGWEVAHVFRDDSKSAYSGKRRPQYQEMLQGIRDGLYDGLLVWGNDRLTRIPRELEDLIDLIEGTGIQIQTVVSGEYDLNTADGRATARIHCAIARQESEKKSERVREKKAVQIANGQTSGHRRAFGWVGGDKRHKDDPLKVRVRSAFVPEEIAVVREMGRRALAGESITGITKWLNEEGITTSQGQPWTRATVRQLLHQSGDRRSAEAARWQRGRGRLGGSLGQGNLAPALWCPARPEPEDDSPTQELSAHRIGLRR